MASSNSILPGELRLVSLTGFAVSIGSFIALYTLYLIGSFAYNIFFHPLKNIPGPLLGRASVLPYLLHMRSGDIANWIKQQHEKYGAVVRLAPNDVSFISGETAWQDIYGFRTGKHKSTGSYLKDATWFPKPVNGVKSIIGANEEDHSRMRRNLSHAFSDRALRDQESIIQGYVDILIHRLNENVQGGKPVDIMRWYNYVTFDIIADLSFAEPLYCLRDSQYHKWVNLVFASIKAIGFAASRLKSPFFNHFDKLINLFANTASSQRARQEFFTLAHDKVETRLAKAEDRPDFFSFIIKNQEKAAKALSREEMDSNAVVFLIAGSETTATTLSGTTWLLLRNPNAYLKLVHEIRSQFTSQSDITVDAVNKLEYMIACLHEGLRLYPPVATGFPRVVPPGGGVISGTYIAGGTSVFMSQHAANRSVRNFKNPDKYVPERWTVEGQGKEGEGPYGGDRREVWNAFSFGPRNCLGKNLAYAEMRLILAKVLFNFDLELLDTKTDWIGEQKVFTLWEKGSLMVKLMPVSR